MSQSRRALQRSILDRLNREIRIDPAQRGLISSEPALGRLGPFDFVNAVEDLARAGEHVVLVTGFYIPGGTPPAAETDGPPGTLLLAKTLERCGISTEILTDRFCLPAVRAIAKSFRYPQSQIVEFPDSQTQSSRGETDDWLEWYQKECQDSQISHLISIERVGPSHTEASVLAQSRLTNADQLTGLAEEFRKRVARDEENRCHNMRGVSIDEYTGDLHRVFEVLPAAIPCLKTIGIGDGANEIGMGRFDWRDLTRRLSGPQAGRVPCRIACDWGIVAGVSNWGAQALACGVVCLHDCPELVDWFTVDFQRTALERMVANGPAVDGVTREQTATVDGLSFDEYIQPWVRMVEAIRGLRPS